MKQLKSFVTVARTKNMAQTALALNYSHSTIYGHLEGLEKEFNAKLYYRTSHGIELSEPGTRLLTYAKKMIELYDEAYDTLSQTEQSILRIGATESGDACIMHDLIREFVSRVASVEIEYAKMTVDVSLSKLIAGTCDVAFVCEFGFAPEEVYSRYLCTLQLIFVTATPISQLKEDCHLPKLLGTMKMPVAIQMMHSVGLEFETCFSSLCNIGDLATIKQLLFYNRGIALLPKEYVEQDINEGLLFRVPEMPEKIELNVYIVTLSKSRIADYTKKFIDLAYARYNPMHLEDFVPVRAIQKRELLHM